MKILYRVKHQYKDRWLCIDYKKYDDIYKCFGECVYDAHIFDSLEEIYALIDEYSLEVQIETIYCGDNI